MLACICVKTKDPDLLVYRNKTVLHLIISITSSKWFFSYQIGDFDTLITMVIDSAWYEITAIFLIYREEWRSVKRQKGLEWRSVYIKITYPTIMCWGEIGEYPPPSVLLKEKWLGFAFLLGYLKDIRFTKIIDWEY